MAPRESKTRSASAAAPCTVQCRNSSNNKNVQTRGLLGGAGWGPGRSSSSHARATLSMAAHTVGRYLACSTPVEASHEAHSLWQRNITQQLAGSSANNCGTFCKVLGDLYLEDRCWNTRALCAVALEGERTTLVVGQETPEPPGKPLQAGRYFTVLGPAAALGVGARQSFADRLRNRLGMPVVNLGRGAAGPSDYVNAWPSISPLLAQSRANIVVLMAGRSSANSAFPAGTGPSGSISMARDAGVKRLQEANDPRWPKLVNESLATALGEYATLASRIRKRAESLGRRPPPFLLLWFSSCQMSSGCSAITIFPQYYTDPAVVQRLAAHIGARLVDASFGSVEAATPLPLDQCDACRPLLGGSGRTPSCLMDDARRQTNFAGFAPQDRTEGRRAGGGGRHAVRLATLGCTQTCSAVLPTYYPHDTAHEIAAAALVLNLYQPAQPLTGQARASHEEEWAHRRLAPVLADLPTIDPRRKLFFNHVHKSAGSTFSRLLRRFPSSTWCEHVMQPNWVLPTSEKALRLWWMDEHPNCTIVSLEEPKLGQVLNMAAFEWPQLASGMMRSNAHKSRHSMPQLASFYRDPVERCLSSWRYEFSLCHGTHKDDIMHAGYCEYFRKEYGDGTEPTKHLVFVRTQCVDFTVSDLRRVHADIPSLLGLGIAEEVGASTRAAGAVTLDNAWQDCWTSCEVAGSCSGFCGSGGACCKRAFPNSPLECGSGALGCDSNHCCVLKAMSAQSTPALPSLPHSPISPPLHFFGMTEAFDASVCLFWYQTSTYTAETWSQSLCTCADRPALRRSLKRYDSAWTRTASGNFTSTIAGPVHLVVPELSLSREEIGRLNPGDVPFYAAARHEFDRRVAIVEERVGHRFLRCDEESANSASGPGGGRKAKARKYT